MMKELIISMSSPFIPYALAFVGIIILGYIVLMVFYYSSNYYKDTHNSFFKVYMDNGFSGEYQTYKMLSKYEKDGAKFLYNCYVPKGEDGTTEIDILMLHKTGIYVLESKNYSGWIFGKEKDNTWTQSLPNGNKNHFYNPIKQNKTHIKWLNELLGVN